jgi:hypothetical protein
MRGEVKIYFGCAEDLLELICKNKLGNDLQKAECNLDNLEYEKIV